MAALKTLEPHTGAPRLGLGAWQGQQVLGTRHWPFRAYALARPRGQGRVLAAIQPLAREAAGAPQGLPSGGGVQARLWWRAGLWSCSPPSGPGFAFCQRFLGRSSLASRNSSHVPCLLRIIGGLGGVFHEGSEMSAQAPEMPSAGSRDAPSPFWLFGFCG